MNIILIGFMGTGKSSVAPLLARKLNMDFIEMDYLIEQNTGKTIENIFKESGELAFREYEIETAKELKNIDNTVISTGGGVVLNKIIIDYLKTNGTVIGLFADFNTIVKRVGSDMPRPLFKDQGMAKKLYDLRKPLYELYADKKIYTDGKNVEEVTEDIINCGIVNI